MDANNTPQQGPARASQPGMPHRPLQPIVRRPMVDGFAPRHVVHPGTPGALSHQMQPRLPGQAPITPPHRPAPHQHVTAAQPQARPATQPQPALRPQHAQTYAVSTPNTTASSVPVPGAQAAIASHPTESDFVALRPAAPTSRLASRATVDEQPASQARPAREKNRTAHAGLASFMMFILFGALLLSPFLPGKIVQNFPFASNTFSTGDSALGCISTPTHLKSSATYNTKAGAPITYTYSTSTTQTGTCNGQQQSAVVGHTSQFNPLGLIIDLLVALAAAIGISCIWRVLFGEKRHKPRTRDE
jgi:hypothetical protein